MTLAEISLLAAAVGGAALLGWFLYGRGRDHGPCVGCGQCRETGVCVLTGKYMGPGARKKK